MPRWHEAGKIKISNPAEVRAKLISRFKMDNILKYYGTSWVNALIDGHQYSAGAACTHKPGSKPTLLLWNHEKDAKNGAEANTIFLAFVTEFVILNIALENKTYNGIQPGYLDYVGKPKWEKYGEPELFYAAIVAWHL